MSTTYLLVPVHLDALVLETERTVVEATADFSELPYHDGGRDRNPDVPYLSEAVLADAFDNENLTLARGTHLHWALPDALTVQGPDGFPAVPNRWLVTREQEDGTTTKWVVESDYLHPDGEGLDEGATIVPVDPDAAGGKPRPFRAMGRVYLLDGGEASADDEYATPLTAAGYGEPTFAAFYPNSASVFGFYDPDLTRPSQGLSYTVVGWYADPDADPVRATVAEQTDPEAGISIDALKEVLQDEYEWILENGSGTHGVHCLCYARLTFSPGESPAPSGQVDVAVGSSPTEALCAYLARRIVESDRKTNPESDAGTYVDGDRATLEEQLEALALVDSVRSREVDTGAGFFQERHEKEFTSVSAGSLWDVKRKTSATAAADASAATADVLPAIVLNGAEYDVAAALNDLNELQARYNDAVDELEGRRRLLFADWYRYMLCAYPGSGGAEDFPDIDEVRRFLLECGVRPILRLRNATGTLVTESDDDGWVTAVSAAGGDSASSLAAQVAGAAAALLSALAFTDSTAGTWGLREIPAPRYWQPNDPVVLLAGSDVLRAPERYGKDSDAMAGEYLECAALVDDGDKYMDAEAVARELTPSSLEGLAIENAGIWTWTKQPWNPIVLEWQAEFFPLASGTSVANAGGDYSETCVLDAYELAIGQPDLTPLGGEPTVTRGASVYEGAAILTDDAVGTLRAKLTAYVEEQVGPDEDDVTAYEQANTKSADDPVWTALQALDILNDDGFFALSQALGGFGDALVMQKQTMQLGVADPIGFAPFQEFAALIADAVGDSIDRAPQPLSDFNPLRAGALQLLNLRLVDSFGQWLDLEWSGVTCADRLACWWDAAKVYLPPRMAEPARLDFRWIAAGTEAEQRTPLPPATPVCGWLLSNRLENSVMVYDAAGTALGSIVADDLWASAPGALKPITDPGDTLDGIPERRLRDVVTAVTGRMGTDPDYLGAFLAALDSACDTIEPESAAQHQGLSLLVGRPVAVVRAALSLETQGLPECDQGWTQFRQDLVTGERETHGIEKVLFPVRIGEDAQLNDGVVGFWVEDPSADNPVQDSLYYSLQAEPGSDSLIVTRAGTDSEDDDRFNLRLPFDGTPTYLTLLLDPRGTLHATCGALPARTLTLPAQHYANVLTKLEVTFLSAPILTGRNQVRIPLAEEPGYAWSWLSRGTADGSWSEVGTQGVLWKTELEETFSLPEYGTLWADLLTAGWLSALNADEASSLSTEKASIVPRDQRVTVPLDSDSASSGPYGDDVLSAVADFLDRHVIGQPSTAPSFAERQVLREGWLKLTPQP